MSHAYFKALLFICVGVCIHSVYGTQDFRGFDRLRPTLPVAVIASVANISLMGFLFTSGFYRKDSILEILFKEEIQSWTVVLFLVGIGLTTCYSLKIMIRT